MELGISVIDAFEGLLKNTFNPNQDLWASVELTKPAYPNLSHEWWRSNIWLGLGDRIKLVATLEFELSTLTSWAVSSNFNMHQQHKEGLFELGKLGFLPQFWLGRSGIEPENLHF